MSRRSTGLGSGERFGMGEQMVDSSGDFRVIIAGNSPEFAGCSGFSRFQHSCTKVLDVQGFSCRSVEI
jgi:hypothetical protein